MAEDIYCPYSDDELAEIAAIDPSKCPICRYDEQLDYGPAMRELTEHRLREAIRLGSDIGSYVYWTLAIIRHVHAGRFDTARSDMILKTWALDEVMC